VRIEIHQGPVDDILDDWEAVFAADPCATPFVSPAWARLWWKYWGRGARPWIVLAREGERAVGIAPLILRRHGPFRVLRILGGEPGDYWDVLSLPDHRSAFWSALFRELADRAGEWDLLLLDALSPGAEAGVVPDERSPLRIRQRKPVRCPAIELPDSFEQYLASLRKKRRSDLARHLKRLEGDLELRELRGESELRRAIEYWHEVRTRQWEASGRTMYKLQTTERFRRFIGDVVAALVPAGMASLWEFRWQGEVAGVDLNFHDARTFYGYLGGYEPKLDRKSTRLNSSPAAWG